MNQLSKASLAVFAACTLVLAACGDDDDSNNNDNQDDTEETDQPSDDTESENTESGNDDTESDDTESDDTESDDTESDDTESDDSDDDAQSDENADMRDRAIAAYEDSGLSTEQAECLVDKFEIGNADEDLVDPSRAMEFFDECDIDVSDFQPGG